MKGDFTRDSFDPRHHYSAVLMQQGRVQLDADWNEQGAIERWQRRAALADLIGPAGGPSFNLGFAIAMPAPGTQGGFGIGPGRYYVNGILCENPAQIAYGEQLGYPFDANSTVKQLAQLQSYVVYLDVWERHVSAYEADGMRETALGWIDTASRMQVVWQVRVLPDTDDLDVLEEMAQPSRALLRATARKPAGESHACSIDPEARYRGLENQLYRVEIHDGGAAPGDARVGATFKWSRENGSVVFPLDTVTSGLEPDGVSRITTVTLAAAARDEKLGLHVGDWVELIDDASTMRGQPEPLLQVRSVDGQGVVLAGGSALGTSISRHRHPLLRRWDHQVDSDDEGQGGALWVRETDTADQWIELEHGVQIQFVSGGQETVEYRSGDYWLIPARSATGDVEWPRVAGTNTGQREALSPKGVLHHYAPLAVFGLNAAGSPALSEQRSAFAPLAVKLA